MEGEEKVEELSSGLMTSHSSLISLVDSSMYVRVCVRNNFASFSKKIFVSSSVSGRIVWRRIDEEEDCESGGDEVVSRESMNVEYDEGLMRVQK